MLFMLPMARPVAVRRLIASHLTSRWRRSAPCTRKGAADRNLAGCYSLESAQIPSFLVWRCSTSFARKGYENRLPRAFWPGSFDVVQPRTFLKLS